MKYFIIFNILKYNSYDRAIYNVDLTLRFRGVEIYGTVGTRYIYQETESHAFALEKEKGDNETTISGDRGNCKLNKYVSGDLPMISSFYK